MCVYDPEIHADGRFTLNEKQIMELKKKGYHFSQIYNALMKIYISQERPAGGFVCLDCGEQNLLVTGTCRVCAFCGQSQGCS